MNYNAAPSASSYSPEPKTFWEEWRGFIVFIVLMFAFRIAIADWNHVPSGSMRPTLIEGDRIWLNKLAYDVKVPYTNIVLKKVSDPLRGDIVVFKSPKNGTRLVKRIVGIPGDQISYDRHQMRLNGQPVTAEEVRELCVRCTLKPPQRLNGRRGAVSSVPQLRVTDHPERRREKKTCGPHRRVEASSSRGKNRQSGLRYANSHQHRLERRVRRRCYWHSPDRSRQAGTRARGVKHPAEDDEPEEPSQE